MKTNNRLKIPQRNFHSLVTRADSELALAEIRALTIECNQLLLARDESIKAIDNTYNPMFSPIDQQLQQLTQMLNTWAHANVREFGAQLGSSPSPTRRVSPVFSQSTQISKFCPRPIRVNAIFAPSGDQSGSVALRSPPVFKGFIAPPAASTV